jgi:aldose 1-epimerase
LLENPGDLALPCGFGTHPYFRVPLGGSAADECVVKLPVSSRWELQDMLPTGKRSEVPDSGKLQTGQRFGELKFDDVFSGLTFDGEWCVSSIIDPASGVTMTQRFDRHFASASSIPPRTGRRSASSR